VTGVVLGSAWLLGALAALAVSALVLPGGHPFDALYNHGVRHLVGTPPLPPNPRPRQFAFLMAAVMLAASAGAFALDVVLLGRVFGVLQLAGCGAYLFGGLCLGSWVYGKLFGAATPDTVAAPTPVRIPA
jgi:hypothetical protein